MSDFENAELDFDKAVGQFRLALGQVLKPLRLYGQDYYVSTATEEIISLSIQLYLRLSGIEESFAPDSPYHVNHDKLNH